jgi:transposase InsO family protein
VRPGYGGAQDGASVAHSAHGPRGGEFTSRSLSNYCIELGVGRELTTPFTPQQNGVVEHHNQTLIGVARSMLKAKSLPG